MLDINGKNAENTLVISLTGRLDSNSVGEAQTKIEALRTGTPHEKLVLDFEKLDYISSAGLREVLRLRKVDATLRVINVSSEVYDIFEMTGFTEMIPVEKAYRQMKVDGCEIIGQGAKGIVYRYDPETIVKVYKDQDVLPDILHERAMARQAFVLGIPTAISYDVVKVGDKYGSVFELLAAESYSKLIKENPDHFMEYAKNFADLLRQIHETTVPTDSMVSIKPKVNSWISNASKVLTGDVVFKLKALVDAVPEDPHMIHGDYHTNNVMVQNGEALLIDMDTLSYGAPIFELASVYTTYVGFGIGNAPYVENFIGLPYQTSLDFYDAFMKFYLNTEDEAKIEAVKKKTALLGMTRVLHHYLKRNASGEKEQYIINYCKEQVTELASQVDSLLF